MKLAVTLAGLFISVSVFFGCPQSRADIVSYWRRDMDTQDQFAFNSLNNTLTLSGGAQSASISNFVPVSTIPLTGASNSASFGFDGSQRMLTSDASTADVLDFHTSDAFTIEGWLNTNEILDQTQVIMEKRQSGSFNQGYAVLLRNNGRLAFFAGSDQGETFDLESTTSLTPNTWYHFAGSFDNGIANLYIDGILESSVSGLFGSGGTLDNNANFILGDTGLGGNLAAFRGNLDEIRIANERLSPHQFLNSSSIPEPSTVGIFGFSIAMLFMRRRSLN